MFDTIFLILMRDSCDGGSLSADTGHSSPCSHDKLSQLGLNTLIRTSPSAGDNSFVSSHLSQ